MTDTGASDVATDVPIGPISFKRDIRPLMNRGDTDPTGHGCKACHYGTQSSHIGVDLGGLDMETLKLLREGGGSSAGIIAIPGNPEGSAIVQKLRGTYKSGSRMPKNGPQFWREQDIALMEQWIREGAKGADDE